MKCSHVSGAVQLFYAYIYMHSSILSLFLYSFIKTHIPFSFLSRRFKLRGDDSTGSPVLPATVVSPIHYKVNLFTPTLINTSFACIFLTSVPLCIHIHTCTCSCSASSFHHYPYVSKLIHDMPWSGFEPTFLFLIFISCTSTHSHLII